MVATLSDLIRALEEDCIVPYFQPIVDLRSGETRGFEVLARWIHPSLGVVLPQSFISVAEEHGVIGELTSRVLRKAFESTRNLQNAQRLAINISPRQMRYTSLPLQICNAANEAGFPLEQLTIEITESALMGNLEQATVISRALKDLGCRLSLDDFGTGYSSLAHLQALPFDQLKVDRSFISSMTERRASRKIVAAILGLGQSLGLVNLAEGVEDDAQAELLLMMGCELAQGWRYGKPMPAEALSLLAKVQPHGVTIQHLAERTGSILEARPSERLAQMQALYDGAPMGIGFLDTKLRMISLNERLAGMLGHTVEWHLGRALNDLYPEMFASSESCFRRALTGEAVADMRIGWPGHREMAFSFQPARDEANEVVGISLVLTECATASEATVRPQAVRAPAVDQGEGLRWFPKRVTPGLQGSH